MNTLRVFAFSPNFNLPTSGPFALKLETWLRMAGIDYERVYEDNPSKGAKGKNPSGRAIRRHPPRAELVLRVHARRVVPRVVAEQTGRA